VHPPRRLWRLDCGAHTSAPSAPPLAWQRHVCEQLAQGHYLAAERLGGVKPATSRVTSQRPNHYTTQAMWHPCQYCHGPVLWNNNVVHKTGNTWDTFSSEEDQVMATVNMYSKFCEMWTYGFEICKSTDRHTDMLITIFFTPARSKVISCFLSVLTL